MFRILIAEDDRELRQLFSHVLAKNGYAPIVFVSALKNQRIHTLFEQIVKVHENYTRRVSTSVLNDILLDASIMNQAPIFMVIE